VLLFPCSAQVQLGQSTISTLYQVVDRPCPFSLGLGSCALSLWHIRFGFLIIWTFRTRLCGSVLVPFIQLLPFFMTIEAMYGYTPKGVDNNFKHYALYNACILDIEYEHNSKTDKKEPVKATFHDNLSIMKGFATHVLYMGVFMSIFSPILYEPYETEANGNEAGYDFAHLVDINLIRNNFVGALYFQITLSTFTIALGVIASVLYGVKTSGAMKNPVLESTSVSDFWGKRWNLIVHGALKRGVFKPVYKFTSTKHWAVLATFLASGIMHEYLLCVVLASSPADASREVIYVAYGKNTAFFLWNAGIIILEFLVGGASIFQWMKGTLPKPLISFFIVCTGLPVAHWFIHPYSKTGFFDDIIIGFPIIREISD